MHELRFSKLETKGRTLTGIAISYSDVATLPWGKERFEPRSIREIEDVILNFQHDRSRPLARTQGGGLTLEDSDDALRMVAILPETREADDTLELVGKGIIAGLSTEFIAKRDRFEGNIRVIEDAELTGIAVVDKPAYPESLVSARQKVVSHERYIPRRIVW